MGSKFNDSSWHYFVVWSNTWIQNINSITSNFPTDDLDKTFIRFFAVSFAVFCSLILFFYIWLCYLNAYPLVAQSKITFSQGVKHQGGDNLTTQHVNTSLEKFISGYEWQSSRFVSNFAFQEEIGNKFFLESDFSILLFFAC